MEVASRVEGPQDTLQEIDFDTDFPADHDTEDAEAISSTNEASTDKTATTADIAHEFDGLEHTYLDESFPASVSNLKQLGDEAQPLTEDELTLDQRYNVMVNIDVSPAQQADEAVLDGNGHVEQHTDLDVDHDEAEGDQTHERGDLSYDEYGTDLPEQESTNQQQVHQEIEDAEEGPASAGQDATGDELTDESGLPANIPSYDADLSETVTFGAAMKSAEPSVATNENGTSTESRLHAGVKAVYLDATYTLCAKSEEDDPDSFFLADAGMLQESLSKLLAEIRSVLGDDVKDGYELHMRIDGLGLDFNESTNPQFLDQTTFQQVLEVYDRLLKQDEDDQMVTVYAYLSLRPTSLHHWTTLAGAADEGQGFWSATQLITDHSEDTSQYDDDEEDDGEDEQANDDTAPDDGSVNIHDFDNAEFGAEDETLLEHDFSVNLSAAQRANPFATELDQHHDQEIEDTEQTVDLGEASTENIDELPVNGSAAAVSTSNDHAEDFIDFSNDEDYIGDSAQYSDAQAPEGDLHGVEDVPLDLEGLDAEKVPPAGPDTATDFLTTNGHDDGHLTAGEDAADDNYLDLDVIDDVHHDAETSGPSADALRLDNKESHDAQQSAAPATTTGLAASVFDNVPIEPSSIATETLEEIDWDHDDDEVKLSHNNVVPPTNSSPVSISGKRSRQADEIDGLDDELDVKRRKI